MKAFVEEGATEGTKTRLQLLINFYSPSQFYINICGKKVQLWEQNYVATFLKSTFLGKKSVQKCGANILSTQSDELYDF